MRRGTEEFEKMLARLEAEPFALQSSFVTTLAERLQDEDETLGPVQHWIEDRGKTPLTDVLRSEHSDEALQRISTANAFGSLRAISRIDFTEISSEAVSLVDAELRNESLRRICAERLRNPRPMPESGGANRSPKWTGGAGCVARRATMLAARPGVARTTHALYYLLADGVAELEASVGARVPSFRSA